MNICNQKWDSVTRNGLSPENWKLFGALHQYTRKFINQNFLQFVSLFDHDRNSDRVKRRFDKYLFFLISGLKYYIESLIKIIINKNLFIWKVMFSRMFCLETSHFMLKAIQMNDYQIILETERYQFY